MKPKRKKFKEMFPATGYIFIPLIGQMSWSERETRYIACIAIFISIIPCRVSCHIPLCRNLCDQWHRWYCKPNPDECYYDK